jgi:hypothetical protein
MKKATIALNGVLVAVVFGAVLIGSEGRATALVAEPSTELAALEAAAGREPTAENVQTLAKAYLDHGQSGMAQALLDRNPSLDTPELSSTRARVALAQGHASEALQLSRLTLAQCEIAECSPGLVGKSLRQVEVLETMLGAGLEDPRLDPEATHKALQRSGREVRLAHN